METQDVLDPNFKQKPVILVSEEQQIQMMGNQVYFPILMSLREGYKTVKEIEEDYNKYMEKVALKELKQKDITSEKEKKEYIEKKKRSDKSLYRYIKDLIEVDFVAPIGKRVSLENPMTEKLFARTAKFFFVEGFYKKMSCLKSHCIESLANLIGLVYDITSPDLKQVEEFSNLLITSTKKITDVLFGEKSEKFVELVDNLSLDEVVSEIQMLSLVELVANSKDYTQLIDKIKK